MKKKSVLAGALSLALVMVVVVGTIAYMTATMSLTNTFTIGGFNKPDDGPSGESFPGGIQNYIIEPNWVEDSVLVPGSTIAKDPYVGIGPNSADDAWAYVYVESDFKANKSVYFELNSGWTAVEADSFTVGSTTVYTSGLFKYDTKLVSSPTDDVWTASALFDEVKVATDATFDPAAVEMTIHAFLHQVSDGGSDIPVATVETAAKAWAAGI